MTAELHRLIRIDRIEPRGETVVVEATPSECRALAERLMVPAVPSLRCAFALTPGPAATVETSGHLQARVVQTCVVSLEDFESVVEERFALRFVPAGTEQDDPDPESEDELPYEGATLDLGEAAAEQLALALDPYPRKPDTALPARDASEVPHPFAGLARLRRDH